MKTPQAYKLISQFNKNDITEFSLFLNSPIHNSTKTFSVIFDVIKDYYKLLTGGESEKLTNLISAKLKLNNRSVKNLLSFLSAKISEYYLLKASKENYLENRIALNRYFLKNNMLDLFNKDTIELKEELESEKNFTEKYFLYSFFQNDNYFDSVPARTNIMNKKSIVSILGLFNNALGRLSMFSIIQHTMYYLNYVFLNLSFGNNFPKGFSKEIDLLFQSTELSLSNCEDKKIITVFRLYYKLYLLLKNISSDNYYNSYKKFLIKNKNLIGGELYDKHLNIMLNYCTLVQKLSTKKNKFIGEQILYLEYYFENKIYRKDFGGKIPPEMLRNYFLICYSQKQFQRLKVFVRKYSKDFKDTENKDMMKFCLAHYYEGTKNYNNALKNISDIKADKYIYKYDLKNLELKIYFEKNTKETFKDECALRAIHNYRETVKKDKQLTDHEKNRFYTFLNYYNSFITFYNKKTNKKESEVILSFLLRKIKKEKSFVMKNWLTEKIENALNKQVTIQVRKSS